MPFQKPEKWKRGLGLFIDIQIQRYKNVLKLTYSQKIDSFQSIEKPHDFWIFKEDMGRLMFSEQGEYVILVHVL